MPLIKIIKNMTKKPDKFIKSPQEYVEWMLNKRKIICNKARRRQKEYDRIRQLYQERVTANVKEAKYEVGDYVLYDISQHLEGNEKKLSQTYAGPYEVVAIKANNCVKIRLLKIGSKPFLTNIAHSKIYHYHETKLHLILLQINPTPFIVW